MKNQILNMTNIWLMFLERGKIDLFLTQLLRAFLESVTIRNSHFSLFHNRVWVRNRVQVINFEPNLIDICNLWVKSQIAEEQVVAALRVAWNLEIHISSPELDDMPYTAHTPFILLFHFSCYTSSFIYDIYLLYPGKK